MEKKAREDAVPQKKKSISFKYSSTNYDDEEDEEDDEELSHGKKCEEVIPQEQTQL